MSLRLYCLYFPPLSVSIPQRDICEKPQKAHSTLCENWFSVTPLVIDWLILSSKESRKKYIAYLGTSQKKAFFSAQKKIPINGPDFTPLPLMDWPLVEDFFLGGGARASLISVDIRPDLIPLRRPELRQVIKSVFL